MSVDGSYKHWANRITTLVDFYGTSAQSQSSSNATVTYRYEKHLERSHPTLRGSCDVADEGSEDEDEYANESFESELAFGAPGGEITPEKITNVGRSSRAEEDQFLPQCFLARIVAGTYVTEEVGKAVDASPTQRVHVRRLEEEQYAVGDAEDEPFLDVGSVSNPPTPTSRKRMEEQFHLREERDAESVVRRLKIQNRKDEIAARNSCLRDGSQPIAAADAFMHDGIALKAAEVASELNELIMHCRRRNQAHGEAISQLRRSKLVRATLVVEDESGGNVEAAQNTEKKNEPNDGDRVDQKNDEKEE